VGARAIIPVTALDAVLLSGPAVVALFAIGIYPTLFAVVTSFRRYNITRHQDIADGFPFVGLDNYRQALTDQTFWIRCC